MGYEPVFNFSLLGCVLCLLSVLGGSSAFDILRPNNLIAYWGKSLDEARLNVFCDGSVDAIVIASLDYQTDALPAMSLQTSVCGNTMFPNSSLANCPNLEADILWCQNSGVAVLISLSETSSWRISEEAARNYADLLWALVLGGSSSTRPFGQTPLDGVVIDIDWYSPDIPTGLIALVDQLRLVSKDDDRRYFWTVATSCDISLDIFDSVFSSLTALFFHVTSGNCSVAHYENKTQWHYGVWDDWVSRHSPRNDFKLFLRVEADVTKLSYDYSYDYADPSRLAQIASDTMTQYPRYFGGILYDGAASGVSNNGFNVLLRKSLSTLALPPTSSPSTSTSSAPVTTQNPLPSHGSESHSSHTRLIVGITIPVLVAACAIVATLAVLRRRRRRARPGDEDLRDATGELIAPYPPPQNDTPDPWVRPVKWVERKSNSSLPEIPRDSPAETARPVTAMHEQPQVLQNPEGLAALETEIGRVGLTVSALLASLGRLGSPLSRINGDNVSETATEPPEYS